MRQSGAITTEFTHVVFKKLSAVEADASRSNQHEFNASKAMRDVFGEEQPRRLDTDFVWMPDDGDFVTQRDDLTWYDSRARHPTRSEYRIYYRDNTVTERATAGALLLIALRPDGSVLLVLAPETGLAAARISWLFGIEVSPGSAFAALEIGTAAGQLLASQLGTSAHQNSTGWEEELEMSAAQSVSKIRDIASAAQKNVGAAKIADDALWEDILLRLPDPPPPEIGGPGLKSTIRGVIAPRSR